MAGNLTPEFETLFLRHQQELVNLSFNIVRDKNVAEDVVQEVFEKLWKNKDHLLLGDKISHYLFKATAHTSLTQLRHQRRRFSLDDITDSRNLIARPGSETVDFKEIELRSRQAIDRLPPRCKTIYILCRHEGMKYKDIADTLGISIKAVENQMGIALKKLREDLKPFLLPDIISLLVIFLSAAYAIFS